MTEDIAGNPILGAAESWSVSADGTVYTFTLRKDGFWSDGVPVTSEDFVFGMRRILAPETAAAYASILYPIKNAEALNSGTLAGMENLGVQAIDDYTLQITLENPTPYFITQLAHLTSYPVPKHVVEALGDDWVKPGNIVSNGAFVLAEWSPQSHIKAVKNPMFFDADNVKIEIVFYYPTEDRSAALRRFRAGELHMNQDFPADQMDWLRENLPVETRIAPYLGIYYYAVNLMNAPLDQTAIRQALSMAIDRETIVDYVMRTGEVAAYSFVPPGVGNYGDPVQSDWAGLPMEERTTTARALLAQAGFGDNTSENHKKVAIAVTAMWQTIGVRATLFNTEVAVHYNDLQEGNFQIGRAGWIADYNDAQNFLFLNQTSTQALNYARYSNPEFDRLMELAAVTADLKIREGYLKQAEALIARDQPLIPIYYYASKNLVSQLVTGYQDAANSIHRSRWLQVAED